MSEYWKSTPKYWCKHCKTFVRDTKLEKTNHEATAKHQGNIKRFLRDLHRGHEREERDKDKAKSEVERLIGVVSGVPSITKTGGARGIYDIAPTASVGREPTPTERKAQLAKLAELGVAVPEDYRQEVAMAGDWQTIAERPVFNRVKKEEGLEDLKGLKPVSTLNVGVRKRKLHGQEEEEEAGATVVRQGWGSTTRRYPGSAGDGENNDLDDLLCMKPVSAIGRQDKGEEPSIQANVGSFSVLQTARDDKAATPILTVKQEDSKEGVELSGVPNQTIIANAVVQEGDEAVQPLVVFKKRKVKSSGSF